MTYPSHRRAIALHCTAQLLTRNTQMPLLTRKLVAQATTEACVCAACKQKHTYTHTHTANLKGLAHQNIKGGTLDITRYILVPSRNNKEYIKTHALAHVVLGLVL